MEAASPGLLHLIQLKIIFGRGIAGVSSKNMYQDPSQEPEALCFDNGGFNARARKRARKLTMRRKLKRRKLKTKRAR